jgi:large subunit ribosomal protein L24
VIAGRDKGKRGKCVCARKDDSHVVVEGVNLVKKHTKPNPMKGISGGIVEKIHADPPVQCGHFQCGNRQG